VEMFAGGIAGMAAWGSVIPIDAVKTRLQGQGIGDAATVAVRAHLSGFVSFLPASLFPMSVRRVELRTRLEGGGVPLRSLARSAHALDFSKFRPCPTLL
jgi:hypothetical protein